MWWAGGSLAVVTLGVSVIGLRVDARAGVAASCGVALATSLLAAAAAFVLAVPGATRSRSRLRVPVATLVGWGLMQPLWGRPLASGETAFHAACGLEIAALAATSLAAAALPLVCPIDASAHVAVSHVAPVALLSLVGAVWGRRALDWTRRLGVR